MSKRTRGTARTTQRRPGARPPSRPGTRPATRPSTLRDSSMAAPGSQPEREADVAEDIIEQPAAAPAMTRATRAAQHRTRVKPGSLLAARAATEYVYVAQDMKRIVVVSAGLFGLMIVLYLLLVVAKVVPLPFY